MARLLKWLPGRVWMLAFVAVLSGCGPEPEKQVQPTQPTQPPVSGDTGSSQSRLITLMITDDIDHTYRTAEGSIAKGVVQNRIQMNGFLEEVKNATSMQRIRVDIIGADGPNDPFTCGNIVNQIRGLPIAAGDTVVIYYAGHGFNLGTDRPEFTRTWMETQVLGEFSGTQPTDMPFISCDRPDGNYVNLNMIAAMVASKKPRLTLVMADACNSFLQPSGRLPRGFAAAAAAAPAPIVDLRLISLFREAQGTVLIAGSERGEYSFYQVSGDPTGLFTRQLLENLGRMPRTQRTTWEAVGNGLRRMPVDAPAPDPDTGVTRLQHFEQQPIMRRTQGG